MRALILLLGLGLLECARSQPATVEAPTATESTSEPSGPLATASARAPAPAPRAPSTLLVFCAAWAMACLDVDRELADATLEDEMVGAVDVQRVDCTDEDEPKAAAMQKRWSVVGVPTVILVDPSGKELGRLLDASDLHRRLHAMIRQAKRH